jgi:hypothetical protein
MKGSRALLSALGLLLASHSASAGSANAVLTCQSASGRTQFRANFPVDENVSAMQITVDGATQHYVDQNMAEILQLNGNSLEQQFPGAQVVSIQSTRVRNGLSQVAYTDSGSKFDMIHLALRSKGKLKSSRRPGGEKIVFQATINGLDPRTKNTTELPEITVSCLFDYQI